MGLLALKNFFKRQDDHSNQEKTPREQAHLQLVGEQEEHPRPSSPLPDEASKLQLEVKFLNKKIKLLEKENYQLRDGLTTIQKNLADSVNNNNDALEKRTFRCCRGPLLKYF